MKSLFIGIGLCLMGSGSLLSLVGHYDGILGAEDPAVLFSQDTIEGATLRLRVLNTPAEAHQRFLDLRSNLLVPAEHEAPIDSGEWVGVQIDEMETEAYLVVVGTAPAPGTLLVFTGSVESFWPIVESEEEIRSAGPILLLRAQDYHEPILFKA